MDIDVFAYRVALAFAFGAAIGVERQWHQKMAGLRTNVLVAVGAACFVAMSDLSAKGVDPTRIAAQVVSGIGFLGAGVIMRDGFNVHGLNTAATLWCSAAVGSLAGSGFLVEGAIGSGVIVLANSLLRPASDIINRLLRTPGEGMVEYTIAIVAVERESLALRADLLTRIERAGLGLHELKSAGTGTAGEVQIAATAVSARRNDAVIEAITAALCRNPLVSDVKWQATSAIAAHG
jgi:putative Mg2+ transporter-C (MgtC) family protein